MHATPVSARPGRDCPLSYRYGPSALAAPATLRAETLWVAGGLYGNGAALAALLADYQAEAGDKALVLNGDFHWFDADPEEFDRINRAVLAHCAMRGNVETELADPVEGAGCGCGYPDWVGDTEVERSNRIIDRLRGAARAAPGALASLRALPMHRVAEVGGARVAIVHGDADSLAGWGFSQEALATPDGARRAREALAAARAAVYACSHTCLPVLQAFEGAGAVINNGAAGMPNFSGTRFGLATRISVRARPGALYSARVGALHLEARPVAYDHAAWAARFLELWPEGSAAHASYWARIADGPRYALPRARRAA
ncbi:MAG TPA: hypothetical protein VMI15_09070 [Burkholderiales bacterium]|nr:hypothetical protein [Burkholderiales bacterium]